MTRRQHSTYDWRRKTERLAGQLNAAHSAAEGLGATLEKGDTSAVKNVEETAHDAVGFVAQSVKRLQVEQPPAKDMDEIDATGSTLAIDGAGVAAVALDVLVNAGVALARTEDLDDTDFLVAAILDAENAYEVGAAIVEAAPQSDEPGMVDLERALGTEGNKTLTKRLTQARPRVLAIKERVAS